MSATRTRVPSKAAEREARLAEVHERLEQAVSSLVTGEDWKRAMEFAARFRARSFNNQMLIWSQHLEAYETGQTAEPVPTYVAGFHQWRALGRHVRKGMKGYQILAPVTARVASSTPSDDGSWRRLPKGEQPRAGEQVRTRMVGSRVAYVWDVSATEGAPLPETPRPQLLAGQAPAGLWDGVTAQIAAHGFDLREAANAAQIHGANGMTDFTARTVHVRTDMDDAARTKTAIHELAHVLQNPPADDVADATAHRGRLEVEAESVALMVAAAHGLDTSTYTVPYVATWAATTKADPLQVVRSTAERVRTFAGQILDHLDTDQISATTPTR